MFNFYHILPLFIHDDQPRFALLHVLSPCSEFAECYFGCCWSVLKFTYDCGQNIICKQLDLSFAQTWSVQSACPSLTGQGDPVGTVAVEVGEGRGLQSGRSCRQGSKDQVFYLSEGLSGFSRMCPIMDTPLKTIV